MGYPENTKLARDINKNTDECIQRLANVITALNDKLSQMNALINNISGGYVSKDYVDNFAKTFAVTVPVSANWVLTANGYYQNQVSVSGIQSTDNPIIDVVLGSSIETNKLYLKAWECVSRITTANNSITLYAYDKAPETAFNIQLKVVR